MSRAKQTQIDDLTATIEDARRCRVAAIRTGSTVSSPAVVQLDHEIALCRGILASLR